eukprot:GHVT01085494.1.p1 GENE.GHVT01085494.1~~GHVT01085494.1.p1  ORF type:complete len:267 (-),score=64.65 GHVT01085494.1:59-859(-)
MSPEEVGGGGSSSDGEDGKVMSKREARRLMLKEQQGARGGAKGGKEKMKRKPEEIVDESPETVQDVACDKTEGSSCQRKLAENQWVPFDPSKIITQAETVEYCPVCGFPPDFCDYGPSWEKCRPWVLANHPEYFPELSLDLEKMSIAGADPAAEAPAVEEKPQKKGKGKTVEAVREVRVQRVQRQMKKSVTTVQGLDAFGVKLDKAARLFANRFACGSSVKVLASGVGRTIEIQVRQRAEKLCQLPPTRRGGPRPSRRLARTCLPA